MRFVTLAKFARLTGYTRKAIQSKIDRGDWIQGREFRKAPDGRNLVDLEGYEKWVLTGRPRPPTP